MRRDDEADGAIDAREFFDDRGVFDVAKASAAVFLWENDAQQAHFAEFGKQFQREMGGFVPLHDVRSDFALGKFANTFAQVVLFVGKREIHASLA